MMKLPEELSSTDFPTEPSEKKQKYRQSSHPSSPDHATERQYLLKLRGQRTKIEQLYRDYDRALNRINRQDCELLEQRSTTNDNEGTIDSLAEHQRQLDKLMLAAKQNELLKKEKSALSEQLTTVRLKLEKIQTARTQGIEEVKEFFMQEIRSMELENGELKQRAEEVEQRLRTLQAEMEAKNQEIERLEREQDFLRSSHDIALKEEKLRYGRLEIILKERQNELEQAAHLNLKLQTEASELNYFVQLEKQKSEQLQLHYSSSLQHLKRQNVQLDKQSARSKEEFDRARQQHNFLLKRLHEAQAKVKQLSEELHRQKDKLAAQDSLHLVERSQLQRKLTANRKESEQQAQKTERAYVHLQAKYDKLKLRYQALMGKEATKQQLQLHSYAEIDRLHELMRM